MCFGVVYFVFGGLVRVSAGNALSYATMPGIFPRLKDILFSGFGTVTQIIAVICFMAGLLPKTHPCFSKDHRDEYGLTKLLAICANGIEFKWKHIDKIIVFALITCGTVIMWLYLVGMILYVVTSPSIAGTLFITANPTNDIAFMMMDKVFGIPGIFNSSVSVVAPFPNAFQTALHELFAFYSWGIFAIALVIFLYHMIHFILEVTQTGKVADHLSDETGDGGGHGFTWLPIRFVVCFGLLMPFGNGLNSAQWITLYTAKFASGLATNAWIEYNVITGDNPLGETNVNLVAKPAPQDTTGLIKGLLMMRSCQRINSMGPFSPDAKDVRPYIVNGSNSKALFNHNPGVIGFMGYPDGSPSPYNANPIKIAANDISDDFIEILSYSDYSDIRIVLGEYKADEPDKYKQYPGKVLPVCGEITIPVTSRAGEGLFATEGYLFATFNILFEVVRAGRAIPNDINQMEMAMVREYVKSSDGIKDVIRKLYGDSVPPALNDVYLCGSVPILGACNESVKASYWNDMMDKFYKYSFSAPAYSAYDFLAGTSISNTDLSLDPMRLYSHSNSSSYSALGQPNPLMMTAGIRNYGWGGAGLWYNKIGERNGSLQGAVAALPQIRKFPMTMEMIKEKRMATTPNLENQGFCEKFNPNVSGNSAINSVAEKNQFLSEEAKALHNLCKQLYENEAIALDGVTRNAAATNPFMRAIGAFFSEFQMIDKSTNSQVNPMAQLASIGKVMIDKAVLGLASASTSYALGGSVFKNAKGDDKQAEALGTGLGAAGNAVTTVAMIGLTSGFVLYYMLPILPFVYFFFAVGRWVKTIFEAMVGVPLWALAHMRVGGPGLPGSAAIGGYFLLLEIFIRPILTVFSLVASFAIFSALVVGLNSVFSLVSQNIFGSGAPSNAPGAMAIAFSRDLLDQFFLSVFYVAIVYTIGTACFKLIDLIPDNIMRWSGAGVQSFGASDISDDLVDRWQWELPQRFNSGAETARGLVRGAVYDNDAQDFAQRKKALEDQEKAKELQDKEDRKQAKNAEMAAKVTNQPGGGKSP